MENYQFKYAIKYALNLLHRHGFRAEFNGESIIVDEPINDDLFSGSRGQTYKQTELTSVSSVRRFITQHS